MMNIPRKSLKDYTNEELITFLDNNECVELNMLTGFVAEILRRMNEETPLLKDD